MNWTSLAFEHVLGFFLGEIDEGSIKLGEDFVDAFLHVSNGCRLSSTEFGSVDRVALADLRYSGRIWWSGCLMIG